MVWHISSIIHSFAGEENQDNIPPIRTYPWYGVYSNSGSYNGRRVVSETNNEGPIPSPEAPRRIYSQGLIWS
jgi:hypothetical protein